MQKPHWRTSCAGGLPHSSCQDPRVQLALNANCSNVDLMSAPRLQNDDELSSVDLQEDDEYGAPTKVGPMSKALIEKMMSEAEGATAKNKPPALRKPPVPLPSSRPNAAKAASGNEERERTSSRSGVRSAVGGPLPVVHDSEEAYEETLLAEHATPVAEASVDLPPPSAGPTPPMPAHYVPPGLAPAMPPSPPAPSFDPHVSVAPTGRSAARPAAFPEWVGVTHRVEPPPSPRDREILLSIAIGVGAFLLTAGVALWILLR